VSLFSTHLLLFKTQITCNVTIYCSWMHDLLYICVCIAQMKHVAVGLLCTFERNWNVIFYKNSNLRQDGR
jgi:hypothetical protein